MNDSDFNAIDWNGPGMTSIPGPPLVMPGPTHFASVARWLGPNWRRSIAAPSRMRVPSGSGWLLSSHEGGLEPWNDSIRRFDRGPMRSGL